MKHHEIAKLMGISERQVFTWAKKGMPIATIEAATKWRQANAKRGTPGAMARMRKRKKEEAQDIPESNIPDPQEEEKDHIPANADFSLEAVLERAKRSEWLASSALERAMKMKDIDLYRVLTDNHAKSVKARLDAETAVLEAQKLRGTLLTLDDAMDKWGSIANSLRMMLDALPKSIGPRCNPADPDLAISALEDWKNNQALKTLNSA